MLRHAWWVVGSVLLVAGVVVAAVLRPSPDFGWFAYTPLSEDGPDWAMGWSDGTRAWVVSTWQLVAAGAAALGAVVLAAGVAYRLGARRARAPQEG